MSRVLKLPGTAISAAPVLADPILTDGSLVLVDPAHPASPWPSGVPASSATVPNLANTQAAALIGAPAALTFVNGITAADGKVERSGKGGLHVALSRTGDVLNHLAGINLGNALKAYLEAHPTNDLYLSWWGKYTRAADTTASDVAFAAAVRGENDGGKWVGVGQYAPTGALSAQPPAGTRRLGIRGTTTADGTFQSVGGTDFGSQTVVDPRLVAHGPISSTWLHKAPSVLTWRVYLEDLTVSGRTYADVDAMDWAAFQAATGSGGRYNGDTYTNPTTLA